MGTATTPRKLARAISITRRWQALTARSLVHRSVLTIGAGCTPSPLPRSFGGARQPLGEHGRGDCVSGYSCAYAAPIRRAREQLQRTCVSAVARPTSPSVPSSGVVDCLVCPVFCEPSISAVMLPFCKRRIAVRQTRRRVGAHPYRQLSRYGQTGRNQKMRSQVGALAVRWAISPRGSWGPSS